MTIQRQEYEVESRRRLQKGILWSLAIHVLVLGSGFALPRWSSERAADLVPASLHARIQPGQIAPQINTSPSGLAKAKAGAAAPASGPAPRLHEVPPRIIDSLVPSASPSISAPSVAASIPSIPSIPPIASSAVSPAPTLGSAAATQEPAAAASSSAVLPASGSLDADALRSYRIALASQAKRFKRYPPQATAAGWAGTVDVRVSVLSGGRATPADLVRSSGYEVLDRAALAMLDAAAQRVMVPSALRGQAFVVTLPVVYSLEDQ